MPKNAPAAAPVTASPQPRHAFSAWRWRTFPVFAAISFGLLVGAFADGRPDTDLGVAVRVVAVLMFSYAVVHMFVTNVVVAGRIKRRNEVLARGGTPAEDVEDELVYRDE